jgi:hypothetical protein
MQQYQVIFAKLLCNDVGLQRNCIQAIIDVRFAKTEERATRAAQKKFERLKRIRHWTAYADTCATVGSTTALGVEIRSRLPKLPLTRQSKSRLRLGI